MVDGKDVPTAQRYLKWYNVVVLELQVPISSHWASWLRTLLFLIADIYMCVCVMCMYV